MGDVNAQFSLNGCAELEDSEPQAGSEVLYETRCKKYNHYQEPFAGGKQPCCHTLRPTNTPAAELRSKGNKTKLPIFLPG